VGIAIVVAILAIVTVWPIIVFLVELVIVVVVGCVHAVLGRRLVVAETDLERWYWVVRGQPASVRLVARIVEALQNGTDLPPGGRFESMASSAPLAEHDVAKRATSGGVRVIQHDSIVKVDGPDRPASP